MSSCDQASCSTALYNPFQPNNTQAYVYGHTLRDDWASRSTAFIRQRPHVSAAVGEGLAYNEAGFSFPNGLLADSSSKLSATTRKGVARGLVYEDSERQQKSIDTVLQHDHHGKAHRAKVPLTDPLLVEVLHDRLLGGLQFFL